MDRPRELTGAPSPVDPVPVDPPPDDRRGRLAPAVRSLSTWCLRLLVIALTGAATVWVLARAWPLLLPLILAVLLSAILWPLVALLRMVLPRTLAAGLCLLVVVVAALGALATSLPQLAAQIGRLAFSVVSGLGRLQTWVAGPPLSLGDEQIGALVDDVLSQLQQNAQTIAFDVLGGLTTVGTTLAAWLLTALLVLVLAFFLLSDGDRLLPWSARWLDPPSAARFDELGRRVWRSVQHYVVTQTALAAADAVLIGGTLWLVGVPLWLPLTVIVFVAAWVPVFGAVASGALACLVTLVTLDWPHAVGLAVIVVAAQLVVSQVLRPVLPGRTDRLHPAVVVCAVVVGFSVAGLAGALLAMPLTTVAVTVLRFLRDALTPPVPPKGPTISW